MDVSSIPGTRASRTFYKPELDVLRFLAFLMIFAAHTCPPGASRILKRISSAGNGGLPIFFALSAYLITELLLRERARTQTIDLPAFYVRRILRIWPLYLGMLLVAVLGARLQAIPFRVLPYIFFVGNFASIRGDFIPYGFGVAWSISVEEQFYLLWPPLTKYLQRRALAGFLLLVWLVSQLYILFSRHLTQDQVWFSTFAQMQYFAIGGAVAFWLHEKDLLLPRAHRFALLASAMLGFLLFHRVGTHYISYFGMGISVVLLLRGFLGLRISKDSVLVYLGKISYGLYIFHIAVNEFVLKHLPRVIAPVRVVALEIAVTLPLVVLIASLSFRFFESPFLKLKKKFEVIQSRPV